MRYKAKSIAALQLALGSLPDKMRVVVSRRVLRDRAAPRRRDHGWRLCGRETMRCRSHRRSLYGSAGLVGKSGETQ